MVTAASSETKFISSRYKHCEATVSLIPTVNGDKWQHSNSCEQLEVAHGCQQYVQTRGLVLCDAEAGTGNLEADVEYAKPDERHRTECPREFSRGS